MRLIRRDGSPLVCLRNPYSEVPQSRTSWWALIEPGIFAISAGELRPEERIFTPNFRHWERYHDLSQKSRWARQRIRRVSEAFVFQRIRGTATSRPRKRPDAAAPWSGDRYTV